ncbi:MAG: hypothetical protein R3A51_04775 [Nannocystaceae bacterium]|nr:hypothetical protein [Myxococcales bacterium]
MHITLAIGAATLAWFVIAAILFFNPIVDKLYRSQEGDPAVRALPQGPQTIARILTAVLIQCAAWAYIYTLVAPALPGGPLAKGLLFALIITLVKVLPRDIDRLLLTTYPTLRMSIEFVIGIVCAAVVGLVFAYTL